jgi:hypothetical protein
LQFNYVYGVEFVELNRMYMAEKKLDQVPGEIKAHLDPAFALDITTQLRSPYLYCCRTVNVLSSMICKRFGAPAFAVGHKSRTLADSNQRSWKGFVLTFSFRKTYFHLVGSFKLDWFLIKSGAESANGENVPTPSLRAQCGHTLKRVNRAFGTRISDRAPIMVDLALTSGLERAKGDHACTF